ncbi:Cytochrome c oxidase assembly factor 1 [Cladobotryum mycophilum]|uniref:Cytochrome c oxidase assembly factor 1 n=1 Tax=Cladobotryum mycophilum TaxID=491253 RepID=A0ABR0T0C3_9HYPO
MLSRIVRRRLVASLQGARANAAAANTNCASSSASSSSPTGRVLQRRWMTPAPKPGDGPLMSRRADRELPGGHQNNQPPLATHPPLFLAVVTACSVAIFNYQKSSSPIISSTLYALRTNPTARSLLGDEIYFKHQIPWIGGEMNQMRGRIDISFAVKGTRASGLMRFASYRPSSKSLFETTAWSLETEDGRVVDLLDGEDPFRGLLGDNEVVEVVEEEVVLDKDGKTRGFRQQGGFNR